MKISILGSSVQGASHKRAGLECQDSSARKKLGDGTVILAVADGHGNRDCPYSKLGSAIAVRVFLDMMQQLYHSAESLESLLTYLTREGEMAVAKDVDAEWKRRVQKEHEERRRETPDTGDGQADQSAVYKQYGTTLLGVMITPVFIFAFQIGDGDVVRADRHGVARLIEDEKILGVETHSLSKMDSWKKALSAVCRRSEAEELPFTVMLSTDGFANSHKSAADFEKTCADYFDAVCRHGADTVTKNLKPWLEETSAMGCGDDITVLMAGFFEEG